MKKRINNLNKSLAENITPDEIRAATSSDLDTVKNNIGTVSNLQTKDKTIVGAINELFQNVDNGKQLIADAIDDGAITKDSTFEAMGNAILEIRRKSEEDANEYIASLKLILTDEDVSVSDEDDMDSLIIKVDEEFANKENEMSNLEAENNELETSVTDTKNRLYELMSEGGYDVESGMNIDSLLDLLELSGIGVNEIKQIAGGLYHTFVLKANGSLWACGLNNCGQLGLGDTTDRTTFTRVTVGVKQIVGGFYHTVILKNDGSVWSCGSNNYGQLGLGDDTQRTAFTQVTKNINNDVKQIVCGLYYTVILKNDGSVWSCGYNNYGQLGLNNTGNKTSFTQVTTNVYNDVKEIICGSYHTFIIKNDGSVWVCGKNTKGQLGLNNTTNKNIFTRVTTNINNDMKQITCGDEHTFILKNDGSVWSCGNNKYGQLGLNDTTQRTTFTQVVTNAKQVICGYNYTVILKTDGSVWSCGQNNNGQLGLGTSDTNANSTFTQATTNISDVRQISCGGYQTYIIKNDDSVWSCGYNSYGQLGLNDTTNRTTFTQVPRGL